MVLCYTKTWEKLTRYVCFLHDVLTAFENRDISTLYHTIPLLMALRKTAFNNLVGTDENVGSFELGLNTVH